MNNALEITNLSKKYSDFKLKNINLVLPKGTIMGFIGENGAGKTTTIKAILNIITDYEGKIKIFNQDNKTKNITEDIGVVLDECFFPEILTPKDINIIMKDVYKNWDSNYYLDYLEKFELPLNKQIKTLSKGMHKKLEILVALAHHPKLLILDEPTSGLDPIARSEILDIFREFIQDEENSILLSSHITMDLENLADYLVFINEGEIILSESLDDILNNYGIVKCSKEEFNKIEQEDFIKYQIKKYQVELLISNKKEFHKKYKNLTIDKITIDELMLLMIKGGK